jgi:hypothetical protein
MRTRKNRKMKRRKTRRRKKGGDTVLEKLSKGIGRFKNSMEGIKNAKTGAELAKIYAKKLALAQIKSGQKAISKMKTTKKKITPCTAAAVADRIACSEKYLHTSSAPDWRPPEWFQKDPGHSEFLGLMCQNPYNISVTLQDGNFDYFRPTSHHNEGCHTRTEDKLLKTSKEMDRKNRRKGEEEYLKLSPEEREKRNKEDRVFNKEHGIGLVSTQQKQHILEGQKQHVLKRKGRGNQHWTKKAQKEKAEKKKAQKEAAAEAAAALERMRMPAVGEGPALPPTLSSQGEEKTCAQILKHGPGYTTTSQAEFTRCNNEAKLVAENQKRRAERKLEQQQKIQTQKKRRNKPKTKKTFGQQRVVGGKRKRRKKTRKRRKRKTKRRR